VSVISKGLQPLDALMIARGLANADLVKASTEQLTFKMVQKARKGKPVTPRVQKKILEAFKTIDPEYPFNLKLLFNY
jgi:hypothetical protein